MLWTLCCLMLTGCLQDGLAFPACGTCAALWGADDVDPEQPIIVGGGNPPTIDSVAAKAVAVPVFRSRSPIRKRIYEVLDRPLDFEGHKSDLLTEWRDSQMTLEELIESISRVHKITVYADLQKMKPDKINIRVPPIYGDAKPSVGTMLDSLLRYRASAQHPLAFVVRDDGLLIAYLDAVEKHGKEFAIYDVSSLPEVHETEFHELLCQQAGVAWQFNDGKGGSYTIRRNNRLIVRHTWFAQQQVHKMLTAMAVARAQREEKPMQDVVLKK